MRSHFRYGFGLIPYPIAGPIFGAAEIFLGLNRARAAFCDRVARWMKNRILRLPKKTPARL